jgi:hypothetical protein
VSALGLATRGYYGGGSGFAAPQISDISPIDGQITPGEPGAFSASFSTARRTPITFHLAQVTGGEITITIKYADRNETYVARDMEGSWVWPFDVQSDNTISEIVAGECDVSMLPRGGWPPCVVEFKVGAAAMAVPA